ncbi:hypothetical protein HYN59_01960 [Flavobacterium album]|uniref:Uncharacterized protein n=1 Tax=Flavobacterium album TaxID=2175091 RepID=A0A2S1QUE2_9FLAO|nr:hypothetical protein [Flavobacterium album]AWH83949.1 hypothetical protein HYN59_01960 [Flavobacterium album]
MNELNLTGGARIGRRGASWPLVTLKLNHGVLELNAGLIGKYVFLPGDVVSIGTYSMTGFGKEGIRIYHNVHGYNERIIFQSFKMQASQIIHILKAAGFPNKEAVRSLNMTQREKEVRQLQASGGFPVKKPIGIAFIVIWNILIIGSFFTTFRNSTPEKFIPFTAFPALGFLILSAVLLLASPGFARIVLKEGRNRKDVQRNLFFILSIAAFMLLVMSSIFLLGSK